MTLFNQNWISFSGEPVTGMTPTQTIVHAPPGIMMNPSQEGGVAHAYNLFSSAVNVSAIPNGYHIQHRVLQDGSKITMTSINGVHKVDVQIGGGIEESHMVQLWVLVSVREVLYEAGYLQYANEDLYEERSGFYASRLYQLSKYNPSNAREAELRHSGKTTTTHTQKWAYGTPATNDWPRDNLYVSHMSLRYDNTFGAIHGFLPYGDSVVMWLRTKGSELDRIQENNGALTSSRSESVHGTDRIKWGQIDHIEEYQTALVGTVTRGISTVSESSSGSYVGQYAAGNGFLGGGAYAIMEAPGFYERGAVFFSLWASPPAENFGEPTAGTRQHRKITEHGVIEEVLAPPAVTAIVERSRGSSLGAYSRWQPGVTSTGLWDLFPPETTSEHRISLQGPDFVYYNDRMFDRWGKYKFTIPAGTYAIVDSKNGWRRSSGVEFKLCEYSVSDAAFSTAAAGLILSDLPGISEDASFSAALAAVINQDVYYETSNGSTFSYSLGVPTWAILTVEFRTDSKELLQGAKKYSPGEY